MNLRVITISILLCIGPAASLRAEVIGLREAERLVLERNLELQAQIFETRASEALIRRGYGIYDPRLQVDFAIGEARQRVNSQFFSANTISEYRRLDFSLVQKLPTGADLIAGFANRREQVDPRPPIDPAYGGELRFTLVQPLLRDFGRTVTEQQILFAIKDRDVAIQDLREKAFDLLSRLRRDWFEALRARDELAYRETSVALARRVLDENQARVRIGVLAPVEALEAEVGLQTRERQLLDSRRIYEDVLDRLGVLLNASEVEPADQPLDQAPVDASAEAGLRAAMEKRPDLLRRTAEIERLALEKRIARNRMLPAVDLSGTYAQAGLREGYGDYLEEVASDDFRNWEIGLTVSYPLGNREARNDYLRAGQRLKGRQALLGQLREEAAGEIRGAIRLIEVGRKKIEVTARGRDLAEEKLRTLIKRREVGLATTRDVLEGEEDLALARTEQIAALADYNTAVTEYLRATGELLDRAGIRFAGSVAAEGEAPLFEVAQPQ